MSKLKDVLKLILRCGSKFGFMFILFPITMLVFGVFIILPFCIFVTLPKDIFYILLKE